MEINKILLKSGRSLVYFELGRNRLYYRLGFCNPKYAAKLIAFLRADLDVAMADLSV